MARQSKVKLTQQKLDMFGVQVTVTVHVGDWVRMVATSPVDMKVFEKWHEVYAPKVVESIVRSIKHEMEVG